MKKTKVLIFNPKLTNGGISKIVSDYIRFMDDDICVELMTLKKENDIYYKDLDINIYEVSLSKNIFKRIYKEYKIIKKSNPDIVHINGDYVSRIVECISSKMANVKKIIIHSHSNGVISDSNFKKIIQKRLKFLFNYFCDEYLACSRSAAEYMFSKKIIKEKKFKIVKNGIDVSKFKFNENVRNMLRKKYKVENNFVIGNVGRFNKEKNHDFLIDVFLECKKKNNKCILLIIGTGVLEDNIRSKVKKLGIDKDVIFLKNINNVYDYYNMMDIFVLPSYFEGLGIVNIEAQTNGLKVITSTNVPIEAKVSKNIDFLSLNDGEKIWANKILLKNNIDRKNSYMDTISYGYDIKSSVNKLKKIYR